MLIIQEKPMSYPKDAKTSRRHFRNFLATALCVCLLGIAFLGAGVCQTPGYGDKPDQWALYERGPYFEQLQKILRTYRFDGSNITYLHFEESLGVGPVELFRIPVDRDRDCNEDQCYFFILIASDYSNTPLVTLCQFKRADISHFFNPDRSHFWGFEFSCSETLLQVKVTPTHFMAMSVEKTP
jgi:hypothetical protein